MKDDFDKGYALVDVDDFGKDKSEYEVYNMTGNVSEWTLSWYDEERIYRVFRGGSWDSKRIDDIYTTYRNGDKPALSSYAIGFRCAKSQ
jgi:formylglycine-generating enzyme required for sulfatase activity